MLYRPFAFEGKMHFSTSRPGKTNEYFATELGRRYYVSKIYKLGADRLWNGASTWWWNITVLLLSCLFSVSSASSHIAILARFARLMAQKLCSHWCTCLLRVWWFQIHYEGISGPKNRQILTRRSLHFRFVARNRCNIRAPESKLPLNVKIPQ